MKRIQKLAVAVTIAAMIGLTGCSSSSTEPTPAPDAAPASSLAETVWDQVEANFPDGITSSSPLFVVTDVEDVSAGTIRVHVQDNITDADREEIARHTFNMGAMKNDDLTTVVVRDLSGKDTNHRR